MVRNYKHVTVREETYWKLKELIAEGRFKSFDHFITHLLDKDD